MKLPLKAKDSKINFSIRMTPLIDVIFLLMIFFIMTIRFQKPEGFLENRLPQTGNQNVADQNKDWEVVRLRIKLIKEDLRLKIYLQDRAVYTYADLLFYLNQLPREIRIVIDPAPTVPYKHVIGVYNTCIKSKKTNIVFTITA